MENYDYAIEAYYEQLRRQHEREEEYLMDEDLTEDEE